MISWASLFNDIMNHGLLATQGRDDALIWVGAHSFVLRGETQEGPKMFLVEVREI